MSTKSLDAHIETTSGIAGGKPRIAGHRITVQNIVVWHVRMGQGVDEIAHEYDLSLADIHAALAHYYDHRVEIDREIAESDAFIEELKQRTPSKVQLRLAELRGHGPAD